MKKISRFFALALTVVTAALMSVQAFASSPFEVKNLSDSPVLMAFIIIAAVITVGLGVVIVITAIKDKKSSSAPAAKPEPIEEVSEEAPAPEAPVVEETPVEEVSEEAPAPEAPVVEETPVEEVAEEAPAPEAPVVEDTPVEEVAEEAPAPEAPVVEETPVEEVAEEAPAPEAPVVKETPVEEVAEEAPAPEAPVVVNTPIIAPEAPAAPANPLCEFPELADDYVTEAKEIPAEAIDPETGCTYTFDENGIPVAPDGKVIRYKWSFLGRLSQAHPEVKYHYLTLRRTLLAYKKMRSNVSWNFDSYFVGRRTIAKLKIRGKNLVVYFPIDPKEMEGTKYVGEDASGVSRYKSVPFAYAINGTRKLKYAIELIEKLMESKPATAPEVVDEASVNTYIPEQTFDTLYTRELIRIGGFLSVGAKGAAEDDED